MTHLLKPLFMLAFDHRQVLRDMLGRQGEPQRVEFERLSDGKALVLEGLLVAIERGVPVEHTGILMDEEYGGQASRAARDQGVLLAMPVEASRTEILELQFGDSFAKHIEDFNPAIVKILVFHNPADSTERKRVQIAELLRVSNWAAAEERTLMLEVIVPPSDEQLASGKFGQEHELRTELLRQTIEEFYEAGIEPAIWKVEGLSTVEDFEIISRATRAGGRLNVSCIVMGSGADVAQVAKWLRMAASVEGFDGFAVGRTVWYEPLKQYFDGSASRAEAREAIAAVFMQLVEAYRSATQSV